MSRIFTYERLLHTVADAMLSTTSNRIVLLLLINLFMVLMGMIMDDISSMLLAAPLLLPLFTKLGISPVQTAIMAVNQGSGQMTPPVAWGGLRSMGLHWAAKPKIIRDRKKGGVEDG